MLSPIELDHLKTKNIFLVSVSNDFCIMYWIVSEGCSDECELRWGCAGSGALLMMCWELELLTFKRRINKISQQTFASVPCSEIIFRFRIQKIRSYLS